jgi:predicted RNA-binding protein YlxR (DUF448 family)
MVVTRDHGGSRPGRGLYTCRSRDCFERARERRGFARGARCAVEVDAALAGEFEDGKAVNGA